MKRFYGRCFCLIALMFIFFSVKVLASDGKFQKDSERIEKLKKSIRDFHHLSIEDQRNNRVTYNNDNETLDRLRRRTERRKKRKEQCEKYQDSSFTLIKTPNGHRDNLLESIHIAEKSLIITTWKLGVCKRLHPVLFKALKNARKKGVNISIYYNELSKSESGNYVLDDLKKINIEPIQIGCHAKFIACDDSYILLGSFNWLDFYEGNNRNFCDQSTNVSMFVKGNMASYLKEQCIKMINDYRELSSYDEFTDWEDYFLRLKIENAFIHFKLSDSIKLLRTPYDHDNYLQCALQETQKTLEVHSPFVKKDQLNKILSAYEVEDFLKKNKKLILVYNDEYDPVVRKVYSNLIKKEYPNFILNPVQNIHQKLVVRDDSELLIGSFNFFSAVTYINNKWSRSRMNYEDNQDNRDMCNFSLVLKGKEAKEKIAELRKEKIVVSPHDKLLPRALQVEKIKKRPLISDNVKPILVGPKKVSKESPPKKQKMVILKQVKSPAPKKQKIYLFKQVKYLTPMRKVPSKKKKIEENPNQPKITSFFPQNK